MISRGATQVANITFNGKLKRRHVSFIEWLAAKYCYHYPQRRPISGSLHVYSRYHINKSSKILLRFNSIWTN